MNTRISDCALTFISSLLIAEYQEGLIAEYRVLLYTYKMPVVVNLISLTILMMMMIGLRRKQFG